MQDSNNEIIFSGNKLKKADNKSVRLGRLLQSVNLVATKLITASPDVFEQIIWESLGAIGKAVGVHRTYIWQNYEQDGKLFCRQTYEWSEGAEPQQGKDFTLSVDYDIVPFWKECMLSGLNINGPIKDLPETEREYLYLQDIVSILIIPIIHEGKLWGFIGFDDCKSERYFSKMEEQVLQSGGIMMVSTILRNSMTQRLIAARNELRNQDMLLRAVNSMAALLMENRPEQFGDIIIKSLGILGESVGMDYAYIWKNSMRDGRLYGTRIAEWSKSGASTFGESSAISIVYDDVMPQWKEMVQIRKAINSNMRELREFMPRLPVTDNVISIAILPVILQGEFWGFIGFDNCHSEHLMDDSQIDILKSGGMLIASAVMRNEMTANLVEARENALSSMRAKSEFLSRMSHEIRTPMNAIIGMTAIAQKSGEPGKVKHCLDKIASSSRQLLSLINDILDMSKIDANKLEIVDNEFDFEKMLENVFNVIQAKSEEKNQNIKFEIRQAFTRNMISDELRLSQVLTNLLSNAVKFTPDGGSITLRVQEIPIAADRSTLHVEVADNGIGIPADRIPNLFQSFEQGDGSITRQYGGTGLGLAICKKIITLMKGDIWVESKQGKGSSFFFEVGVGWGGKCTGKPKGASPESSLSFIDETDKEADWSDKKILLVEDIEINSEIIMAILENTRVAIDCAYNGRQAVELYRASPDRYDLILMDIQMPVMDGLEATRQIRASGLPGCDTLPILAMTANAFKEDEQDCLKAGMNGHVAKPIETEQIFRLLARYLNSR